MASYSVCDRCGKIYKVEEGLCPRCRGHSHMTRKQRRKMDAVMRKAIKRSKKGA